MLSHVVLAAGVLLVSPGCAPGDAGAPEKHPFRVVAYRDLHYDAIAADLDGDGTDEVVDRFLPTHRFPASLDAVRLSSASGQVIDQFNFEGMITTPVTVDIDGDGRREIIVPGIRRDSLFLNVVDGTGALRSAFFVATGTPRVDRGNVLPWMPMMPFADAMDVDGDGNRELVVVLVTGFARYPRGVYMFAIPSGRLLGRSLVGASLLRGIVADFDTDGEPELLVTSTATNNGASTGGLDDSSAYLALFDLIPEPRLVRYRRFPVAGAVVADTVPDENGDGIPEILLSVVAHSAPGGTGMVEVFDPRAWTTVRQRHLPGRVGGAAVTHLDRDGTPEIALVSDDSHVMVVGVDLEIRRRRAIGATLARVISLPDADGDGLAETVAVTSSFRSFYLRPDLTIKAVDALAVPANVLRRAPGQMPLVVAQQQSRVFMLRSLEPNPWYLAHRYGAATLLALGAVLAGLLSALVVSLRAEVRVLRAVAGAEAGSRPALIIGSRGRIRWVGADARQWFDDEAPERVTPRTLDELAKRTPALAAALGEQIGGAPPTVPATDSWAKLCASVHPVTLGLRGDPHWLVVRHDDHSDNHGIDDRAWLLLAQRVAHSIKNPLTSIRLSLQRMQMEYRDRVPAVAAPLDRYVERVEEQIDDLRRMTSNFLKFADIEEPRLEAHDLNRLVRDFADRAGRALPPDIRLDLSLARELPAVRIDRDQLLAVLDNLVANAVNAMRDGGRITVATSLARGVQWDDRQGPRDFAQLEVLDTGSGIPLDVRERLFEAGVSGSINGSGLGLSIVRKIVDDHGGRITWESEIGVGTAFTLYVPVVGLLAPDAEVWPGDRTHRSSV